MLTRISILFFLTGVLLAIPVSANKPKADNIGLAALLLRSGDYERAWGVINTIDTKTQAKEAYRYFTLRGLIALNREAFADARDAFINAAAQSKAEPMVHIHLARAYYGLRDYAACIREIDLGGETGTGQVTVWLLKSAAYWQAGDQQNSWSTLLAARERFPDERRLPRQQFMLLAEMGLYQEAMTLGSDYFQHFNPEAQDSIAFAQTLLAGGQVDQAISLLETARLRFADSIKVKQVLAHAYLKQKRYHSAADLLEEAAQGDSALIADAAELRRKSRQPQRALYLNTLVREQDKKLKQRLALLIESGRFSEAVQMDAALKRVGLLDNQEILYALAYANFKLARFPQAQRYLEGINRSDLFNKVVELNGVMQGCTTQPWNCL